MFPLQRGNELVIQFSNSPHQRQQKISEDLILEDYASLDVNDSDKIFSNSRSEKLFYGADEDHGNYSNDHKKKKMVHREIERQRRQEMATLYASLRSLLPLEFIKVKNLYMFLICSSSSLFFLFLILKNTAFVTNL